MIVRPGWPENQGNFEGTGNDGGDMKVAVALRMALGGSDDSRHRPGSKKRTPRRRGRRRRDARLAGVCLDFVMPKFV